MTVDIKVEDPRQIVALLHAEIAALSPEHAALVAAFEALPRKHGYPLRRARPALPGPGSNCQRRVQRLAAYTSLRLSGTGKKAAARRIGVGHGTGRQYEADFLAALGGVP